MNTKAVNTDSKINESLTNLFQTLDFSGAIFIAQDETVLLRKGYALADRDRAMPNTPQTRFRIGSLTKQFTAMAILILQNQGRLKVQDRICNYFSQCPAAWQEITIHHLLSHTSGIIDFTELAGFHHTKAAPTTPLQTIARFKDLPLAFTPGEMWSYSNSGYIVLGYIIEQASGQSYETFLKQNIFDPLQMTNTGYDHQDGSLAVGYTSGWQKPDDIDMTVPFAAGGLYATIDDLYLWDQALYTEKLVPKTLMNLMFTSQVRMSGFEASYGYGWFIDTVDHRQAILHGGAIEGFSSYLLRHPAQKVTIIILSNCDTYNTVELAMTISSILFQK